MLGLVLLTASCTEDYTDWANPQENPQEEVKTVTMTTTNASDVDFANLESDAVQLFVPASLAALPLKEKV